MKFSVWLVVSLTLLIGVGCAVAPTPTPSPVPTPVPSPAIGVATPNGMLITSVANRRAPADVPACPNAQVLPQAIELTWTGTEDVRHNAPDSNWTYYRCGGPAPMSSHFIDAGSLSSRTIGCKCTGKNAPMPPWGRFTASVPGSPNRIGGSISGSCRTHRHRRIPTLWQLGGKHPRVADNRFLGLAVSDAIAMQAG